MSGRILAIAVALVIVVGAPAWGAIEVNNDVVITQWVGRPDNQGVGPLWATIYHDTDPGIGTREYVLADYFTFCAEINEGFTPGIPYNIAAISYETQASAKTLTGYSAWVFDKFLNLAFTSGWNKTVGPTGSTLIERYGSTTTGDYYTWGEVMDFYQTAIWAGLVKDGDTTGYGGFAGTGVGGNFAELTITDWSHYDTVGLGHTAFVAGWHSGNLAKLGEYEILVIKTGDPNPANKQDLLFLTKGQHVLAIPEPTSVAIWGLIAAGSVCGMSMGRRRRFTGAGAAPKGWNPNNRLAIRQIVERGRRA